MIVRHRLRKIIFPNILIALTTYFFACSDILPEDSSYGSIALQFGLSNNSVSSNTLSNSLSGTANFYKKIVIKIDGMEATTVNITNQLQDTYIERIELVPVGKKDITVELFSLWSDSIELLTWSQTQSVNIEGGKTAELIFTDFEEQNESLLILSPQDSEELELGSTYNITWTHTHSKYNVKIDVLKNGIVYDNVVQSTDSDGSYEWVVPMHYVLSNDYKIKITSLNNENVSDNSGNISIVESPPNFFYNIEEFDDSVLSIWGFSSTGIFRVENGYLILESDESNTGIIFAGRCIDYISPQYSHLNSFSFDITAVHLSDLGEPYENIYQVTFLVEGYTYTFSIEEVSKELIFWRRPSGGDLEYITIIPLSDSFKIKGDNVWSISYDRETFKIAINGTNYPDVEVPFPDLKTECFYLDQEGKGSVGFTNLSVSGYASKIASTKSVANKRETGSTLLSR